MKTKSKTIVLILGLACLTFIGFLLIQPIIENQQAKLRFTNYKLATIDNWKENKNSILLLKEKVEDMKALYAIHQYSENEIELIVGDCSDDESPFTFDFYDYIKEEDGEKEAMNALKDMFKKEQPHCIAYELKYKEMIDTIYSEFRVNNEALNDVIKLLKKSNCSGFSKTNNGALEVFYYKSFVGDFFYILNTAKNDSSVHQNLSFHNYYFESLDSVNYWAYGENGFFCGAPFFIPN